MKRLFAVATFAALLTVAACGSAGGNTAGAGARQPSVSSSAPADSGARGQNHGKATITIKNFGYAGDLTVEPGEDVTVVNRDSTAHTLTDDANTMFDTGIVDGNGGTGTFVAPTTPGKYPFGCTLHPEMSGVLTVAG